jgi:hypothetical protein
MRALSCLGVRGDDRAALNSLVILILPLLPKASESEQATVLAGDVVGLLSSAFPLPLEEAIGRNEASAVLESDRKVGFSLRSPL